MSAVAPAERVLELAMAVRERVLPFLGAHSGRSLSGEGAGGDITFAIDSLAEEALDELVPERTAFYSEDRGLVAPPDAIDVLVVDPIDGTRLALTRIVTGQLDAVIEVGSRLIDDVPGMRSEFERIGGGKVLNNSPYDLAAPWLCLREAGGVVSDGWGEPLDRHRLLGSGHDFQMSSISAANGPLHALLVRAVDAGVARLRSAWTP